MVISWFGLVWARVEGAVVVRWANDIGRLHHEGVGLRRAAWTGNDA
jgi:hypothetical protein